MQSGAILLEESLLLRKTHLESDCSKAHPEPLAGICPFTYTAVPAQLSAQLYPYSVPTLWKLSRLTTASSFFLPPCLTPVSSCCLLHILTTTQNKTTPL